MSGVNVHFPGDELNRKVDAAGFKLQEEREDLLEKLGVMLLSLSQEAYQEKSQGRVGDDGEKWDGIQLGSLLARLRHAGHLKAKAIAKTKVPKAIPLRKKQKVILQTTAAVYGKGNTEGAKESRRQNINLFRTLKTLGVSFHDKKTGREVSATRGTKSGHFLQVKNHRDLKAIVPPTGYQIGVENGLQRASGSPERKGKVEGGVFIIDLSSMSITVGYGMEYSKYFDEQRKLIPDVIPDPWLKDMEEMVGTETGVRLERILKQEGLS